MIEQESLSRNVNPNSALGGTALANQANFLSHVRHDLRTPLNAILGYSEMLLEQVEEDERRGFLPDLEWIGSRARLLLRLINSSLNTSQPIHNFEQLRADFHAPLGELSICLARLVDESRSLGYDVYLDDLGQIERAAQRLTTLIDDLLTANHFKLLEK